MFQIVELLWVFQFLQSSDGRLYCDDRSGVAGPDTTSHCSHAGSTIFFFLIFYKLYLHLIRFDYEILALLLHFEKICFLKYDFPFG